MCHRGTEVVQHCNHYTMQKAPTYVALRYQARLTVISPQLLRLCQLTRYAN